MKRKISLLMVIVMMLSFTTGVFADGVEQEKIVITLEDGTKVSEREFIEILESYEGEIYKISSETNIPYDILEEPINNIQTRSTMEMPMDDVIKLMLGTWMIPGIGKVVVTLSGIFVGGVVLYKVSSTTANKVKSWLIERAEIKYQKIVNGIPSRFRNGNVVDLGKFNKRVKNNGKIGYQEKGGWVIEKDNAGNKGHGGSKWKLKTKRQAKTGKGREATLDSNGKILRK